MSTPTDGHVLRDEKKKEKNKRKEIQWTFPNHMRHQPELSNTLTIPNVRALISFPIITVVLTSH
jgi:hypothetical protein